MFAATNYKKSKSLGKRKALTIEEKLDILSRFERNERTCDIVKTTGLNESTLRTIRSNAEKIKQSCSIGTISSAAASLRTRPREVEEMERLLSIWVEDQARKGFGVNMSTIKEKALSIYEELREQSLNDDDFVSFGASTGWYRRFKTRYNLHNVLLTGGGMDDQDEWNTKELPPVVEIIDNDEDSVPLQQRLPIAQSKSPPQIQIPKLPDSLLKSQPLSPTKLKVTRAQQTQVQQQQPKNPEKKMPPSSSNDEEVCLRWNSHHSNMQTSFPSLLQREQYVDVTLAAEGKTLKCHKLILSSCSMYFDEILSTITPLQHPVIFLKDIPFWIIKSLCDFMYAGEVHIEQNKLEELLQIAEVLKIKGLARKTSSPDQRTNSNQPDPSPTALKAETVKPEVPQETVTPPSVPAKAGKLKLVVLSRQQQMKLSSKMSPVDPLNLLQPSGYVDETQTDDAAVQSKPAKDLKAVMKKGAHKKVKKRKSPEPESPSPMQYRRGTRTRPQVKIPKYYHDDYQDIFKPSYQATSSVPKQLEEPIIPVETIKSEPIDLEDSYIEYDNSEHEAENPPFFETNKNIPESGPHLASAKKEVAENDDDDSNEEQRQCSTVIDDNFKITLSTKHLEENNIAAKEESAAKSEETHKTAIKQNEAANGAPDELQSEQEPMRQDGDETEEEMAMPVLSPHTEGSDSKCKDSENGKDDAVDDA